MQQEREWLGLALKGDAEAFSELVRLYQRPVYNMCYRMLGNPQEAEDAAQETFLRAYRALKSYDPKRKFATWLLSVAANYCIDQHRKRRITQVDMEAIPAGELSAGGKSNEAHIIEGEAGAAIQDLLDGLPPKDRAALILHYWYDYSYKEISKELSLTESAVKSRMHRARRSLAEQMQSAGTGLTMERRQHEAATI